MLKLLFLGRPLIYFDNHIDQSLQTELLDKGVALLAYLALNPGEHSRETLAGLLWGELTSTRAKANLRFALHQLGKFLPDYLLVSRRTAGFDHQQPHEIDVVNFRAWVQDKERREAAIELVRGELLEGLYVDALGFEEWLRVEREALRQAFYMALKQLTEQYQQNDELALAAAMARRQIEIEPLNEAAYRTLMRILAVRGEINQALRLFAECEAVLQEELALDPMPETAALVVRLQRLRKRPTRLVLPPWFNPFVGREDELRKIKQFFQSKNGRLLTLIGTGGVGKTRLATAVGQQLAADFLEGVVLVQLNGLQEATFLPRALVDQLADHQVIEPLKGGEPAETYLVEQLKQQELLLILDNFEPLIPQGTALLGRLLEETNVSLLVTTRRRINSRWEHLFLLNGLPYPADENDPQAESFGAVQLLLARIQQVNPALKFDEQDTIQMAKLCQLTEGLPLALELAAAWAGAYTIGEITAAITQGIELLRQDWPDMPLRQRSIQATFDYSWQLLDPEGRTLLAHLALFESRISEAAAQAVVPFKRSLIQKLVNQSLVRQQEPFQKQMIYELHPLVKAAALGKLTEVEELNGRQRLMAHYVEIAKGMPARLKGEEQQEILAWIAAEMNQLQIIWKQLIAAQALPAMQTFMELFAFYFRERGGFHEGIALFDAALVQLRLIFKEEALREPSSPEALLMARLLLSRLRLHVLVGDFGQVPPTLDECEPIFVAHQAWHELGLVWRGRALGSITPDVELIRAYGRKSLEYFKRAEDNWEIGRQLINISINEPDEEAKLYLREAAALLAEIGDKIEHTRAILFLGTREQYLGKYEESLRQTKVALAQYQEIKDRWGEGLAWLGVAGMNRYLGRLDKAQEAAQQAYGTYQSLGYPWGMAVALYEQGLQALLKRDFEQVCICIEQMEENTPVLKSILTGRLAYEMGDFTAARRSLLAASEGIYPLDDKFAVIPYDLGWVALGEGNLNEAASYFRQSLSAAVSQKRAPYGMYGLVGLAACQLRDGAAAAEAIDWLKAVVCDPRTHYRVRLKGQELLGEETMEPLQPFDWLAVVRPLLDAERIKG